MLDFIEYLILSFPDHHRSRRRYLDILGDRSLSTRLQVLIGLANQQARQACLSADAATRAAARRSIDAFRMAVSAALRLPHAADDVDDARGSFDAGKHAAQDDVSAAPFPELTTGEFVFRTFEVVQRDTCPPAELRNWCAKLAAGKATRRDFVEHAFAEAARTAEREAQRALTNGATFYVMGTGQRVSEVDWQARSEALAQSPETAAPLEARHQHYFVRSNRHPLVSVIASLYRGGAHIERFLANMVRQTCFAQHVELIIIDANSPDGEHRHIERCAAQHPNVRYLRMPDRIGIYEAWNVAIAEARGEYLTNANVDDLRRTDSIELQAATLDNLPFVDVVYQDFYYTMDSTLSYEDVAAFGYKSRLPLVTPSVMLSSNPPHNAPMWRKRLHSELGLFDTSFQSAGDYEFWLRCVVAGKTFFKLDAPHTVYYQNPHGVSTRPETRGHEESRTIRKRHGRKLVSPLLGLDDAAFAQAMAGLLGDDATLPLPPVADRAAWLDFALLAGSDHRGPRLA